MFIGLVMKRKEGRRKRKKNGGRWRRTRNEERKRKKNRENERTKRKEENERKKNGRGERKKPHEECVRVSSDTCVAHPTHLNINVGSVTTGTATTTLNETITPSEKVVTSVIKT